MKLTPEEIDHIESAAMETLLKIMHSGTSDCARVQAARLAFEQTKRLRAHTEAHKAVHQEVPQQPKAEPEPALAPSPESQSEPTDEKVILKVIPGGVTGGTNKALKICIKKAHNKIKARTTLKRCAHERHERSSAPHPLNSS